MPTFCAKILDCLMVFLDLLQFLDNFVRHVPVSKICSMILECLVAFLDLYKLLNVHCQPDSSVDLLLQDSRKPHGVLKSLQFLENIVSHGQLRMLI